MYRVGVEAADEMFGDLVSMLERKGALDNAIVVILSDHGEALGAAQRHDDQHGIQDRRPACAA